MKWHPSKVTKLVRTVESKTTLEGMTTDQRGALVVGTQNDAPMSLYDQCFPNWAPGLRQYQKMMELQERDE